MHVQQLKKATGNKAQSTVKYPVNNYCLFKQTKSIRARKERGMQTDRKKDQKRRKYTDRNIEKD